MFGSITPQVNMRGYIYLDINQLKNTMSEKEVQIFIDKKEILYSHQNILQTIYAFLPYLTNPDLVHLTEKISTMEGQRKVTEEKSIEERKHIPIQSNRHDTPSIHEHDQTWGSEYEQ